MDNNFDVAIIGAGPGGYVAAIRAAQLGKKVCVTEKREVGGVCLNLGCIPAKAALAETKFLSAVMERFGQEITSAPDAIWEKILNASQKPVPLLRKGIESLFKQHAITIVRGEAKIENKERVVIISETQKVTLNAKNIIIATGSKPAGIGGIDPDHKRVLVSDDIFAIKAPPKTISIIGAGAVGCEFATLFNSVCREVHLIEMMPSVMPFLDRDISSTMERELKKSGIKIYTSSRIADFSLNADGVKIKLTNGTEINTEKLLIATGRERESKTAKDAGISISNNGRIITNEFMETSIAGIYAAGDCTGKMMLAHTASQEGIVAAERIAGADTSMDYTAVPYTVFTVPEAAVAGMTEAESRAKGISIRTSKIQLRIIGRPHADNAIAGEIKLVAEKGSGILLGAQIIGKNASEIIHTVALAIKEKLHYKKLSNLVFAHPTYSEIIRESAEALNGMSIHTGKQL